MENTRQKIQDEMATELVNACGGVGVLNMVDNDELDGDVKIRHHKATEGAKKVGGSPAAQAIYARMFGLI